MSHMVRVLSAGGLVAMAVVYTVGATSQQQGDVRMPENLPDPVSEAMRVNAAELDAVLAGDDVVLLDVREPWELERFGTREGYVNIPLAELELRLDELPRDKTILTA